MNKEIPKLIRISEVAKIVGFSESTIRRMTKEGTFPSPKKFGKRTVVWNRDEILDLVTVKEHA
jgi:excisionase family DNA binding protein